MIKIKKNFEIVPLTINPLTGKKGTWISQENNIKSSINFTDEELKLKKKQLTPPKKQTKIL